MDGWMERELVRVRVRGVNYISVCWHVAQPFLPVYMYEQGRGGEGKSLKLWWSEWKDEGKGRGEDEKEEKRWGEGTRSMRGLALHWHAACSTYTPLLLTLSSFLFFFFVFLFLFLFLTSKFLGHSDRQEYGILSRCCSANETPAESYPV